MSRAPEIVVITGASTGVGRATARIFAKHGASVALLARGQDGLEAARKEVEELGGKAPAIPVDAANADESRPPQQGSRSIWAGSTSG